MASRYVNNKDNPVITPVPHLQHFPKGTINIDERHPFLPCYDKVPTELGSNPTRGDIPSLGFDSLYHGLHKNDDRRRVCMYLRHSQPSVCDVTKGGLCRPGAEFAESFSRDTYVFGRHGVKQVHTKTEEEKAPKTVDIIGLQAAHGNVETQRISGTDDTGQTPVLFGLQKPHGNNKKSIVLTQLLDRGVEDMPQGQSEEANRGLLAAGLRRRDAIVQAKRKVRGEEKRLSQRLAYTRQTIFRLNN